MGEDGAKRVVVNSVGREIRTLEEIQPTEGKRLQLTIDSDVQRAVEDGLQGVRLQRRGGDARSERRRGARVHERARPTIRTRLPPGIDRATWAALNTDDLRPLQDRAIQGRYSPGSTFKMAVATAALEEGVITPDFQVNCPGTATFFGRSFKCWKAGGHGSDRPAPRDRAVVQRLLLHGRQHGRHRQDQQVGDAARPGREERHRSAERSAGPGAVARVEAASATTRSGMPAKRFRCRSVRARSR